MYTFHQYYLIDHLFRKLGYDAYLAYPQDNLEQRVLLKVFDAECLVPETSLSDFQQMEIRLQGLKHPHIVAVLELGMEQGRPYIVSAYLPGDSLRQYLDQRSSGHLSFEEAVGVVIQVGQATAFAHTQGMIHQDIRPENILLNTEGKALLTNFNLGSIIQESESHSNQRMLNYQAPEQLIGAASAASDQYALGCLLYELMTGVTPDPPLLRQHATLTTLVASTTLPKLPRQLEAVILRTLAMKPRERYPDIITFLAELKSAAQPEPPAFPFAHLTEQYQHASATVSEEDFPLLPPISPFTTRVSKVEKALPAPTSLEAFLTIPEWEGNSLLHWLAVADGQEDVLLLSGISEVGTASKEHLPLPEVEEENLTETNPLMEMALANFSGEDLLALQRDTDQTAWQEKRSFAGAEGKEVATSPSVSEAKGSDTVIPPVKNAPFQHSNQADSPTRQSNRNGMPMKSPSIFAVSSWPKGKQPLILLGAALLLTFISAGLLYSFHKDGSTIVGNSPVAKTAITSITNTNPAQTGSTSTTRPQPTHAPSPAIASTPTPSLPTPVPTALPKPTSAPNSIAVPIGKTIWLQAVINGNYVSARIDHSDARLEAMSSEVSNWEKFDVVDAGNGYITLRAHANSNYICAQLNQTNKPLQASSPTLQNCTKYLWIDKGNGRIALQVVTSASYVSVRIDLAGGLLSAQDTNISSEILFLWGKVSNVS